MKRMREVVAGVGVAALLAACGGGSGGSSGDLELTFSYPNLSTSTLWEGMGASPSISGLEGHSPHCSVSDGTLPQGVTLDASTCVVSGMPMEAGNFGVTVKLTVSGFGGYVTANVPIGVVGPTPNYGYQIDGNNALWAYEYEDAPQIGWYNQKAGDSVSFDHLGDLPRGLTFDTQTGLLSGTPSEHGEFIPRIRMTVTREGHTFTSAPIEQVLNVTPPVLDMFYDEADVATIGEEHNFYPSLTNSNLGLWYDDYTYKLIAKDGCPATLPAGWVLTPRSGKVTGTASAAMNNCVGVRLQVRNNGLTTNFDTVLKLVAR